jgi:glycosyltransferase involved in cell wall biosynthesis
MNRDNKTLIILTPGFPKDETDTACLPFLQNFVRELRIQFPLLHVVILSFDYPFTKADYRWYETQVISFSGWKMGKMRKLFTWLLILRKMKRIIGAHRTAGLLSLWCGKCAYLGNRFAKSNNLKHFCWIQGQDAKKENKYVSRIKPLPTDLIAISDFIQEEFEKNHGIRPGHVIPVGIRPEEFISDHPGRDIDILGVGSMIALKQYHLFVEIIYQVKQLFPGIHAVLCGKGPEENAIKMLIVRYGLQENIILTGELPHDEVLLIMMRSKVFLHTSNYEGFSVACMEALYAGCYVISFIQAMHYDIEHWYILRTKEQMVEKARTILSNPEAIYKPVKTFTTLESVQGIMQLFD